MRILVIKTSSLGDVIHTLPALTDAYRYYPHLQCDWVVEEAFAEIPTWHPAVKQVIPVALRRWRQQIWQATRQWHSFKQSLTATHYDFVIDAQGLLKSAWLTYQSRGLRCGFDWRSAREPLATLAYQRRYAVAKPLHAITRLRQLLAASLGYPLPETPPDYGIAHRFPLTPAPQVVFLPGTTWVTKQWPEHFWLELAHHLIAQGYSVRLPWHTPAEYQQAQRIARTHPHIHLLPKQNLPALAQELTKACAVVGVDTGLAHLAAALTIPSITLYGATHPTRTGTYGRQQIQLATHFPCAPCFQRKCTYRGDSSVVPACYQTLPVKKVWQAFQNLMMT